MLFQAHCRGYLLRREKFKKLQAVKLLQAHTRGMLARQAVTRLKREIHLSAREKAAQEVERRRQQEAILQKKREASSLSDSISDQEMVDNIFGFLPSMVGGQEGNAPAGFEDLEEKRAVLQEVDLDELPIEAPPEEELDERELEEYSFSKFAAMYFQGSATHTHIRNRLRHPLLYHEDESDALASLAVWWVILRFMGDIPEPRVYVKEQQGPVESEIPQNQGQRQGRRLSTLAGLEQKLLKRKKHSKPGAGTLKKIPAIPEEREVPVRSKEEDVFIGEGPLLDKPMSALEKLHFIVGNAILRPDIRDEIYSQICKQLSENGSRNSYYRGWILLSICLGIFPPTERFSKFLNNFIRIGPVGYAPYCVERLRRTTANGVRCEPPSWLELQATKTKKPMTVSVTLMDGRNLSVPLDSASTAAEVCQSLAKKINLHDIFGFSIYIALYEKVWSLGGGKDHILDAISQCEQVVKGQGGQEQHAPWRLYFRKEIFVPWHDCRLDMVSTDLIYRQIIRGLKFGEYTCEKDDDVVQLAAKHYYIQYKTNNLEENSRRVVQDCITNTQLEAKSESKWIQMVSAAHSKGPFIQAKIDPGIVKCELVDFARNTWHLLFSRFFEVSKFAGPPLPKNKFIIVINWKGISFIDEKEKRLLDLSYPEVTGISTSSAAKAYGQSVSLSTLRGEDYVLTSANTVDITDLILNFLKGLKERSQYAVALQDIGKQDDATFLSCKKGDLIVLLKDKDFATDRGWVKGQNDRTNQIGAIATDSVFILPTLEKPSEEVLNLITLSPEQRKSIAQNLQKETAAAEPRIAPYSLKEYSYEHFRYSLENGWQLMWMCCGLFTPSPVLMKHTQRFLESRRREPLAADCLQRLQVALRMGARKLPPHQVEVDAIQQMSTQIFHKVHFPNDTEEIFEVGSSTRIRDLCQSIAMHLKLISAEGFSLFLKTPDKVLSLNDGDFFFDSLRQITDWTKKAKRVKDNTPGTVNYVVFFMRKLWFNVLPGRDLQADIIFHYPQELPKYLRGYHKCAKEDVITLAGLVFKIKFNSDKSYFVTIPKILKDLVPVDHLKLMSTEEWKKNIIASYNKYAGKTVDEAKLSFLKIIHRWPTFGCAFFEVKQTSEPTFPDIVMIAISKQGVTLIHPKTKDVLANYPFNRIANWCSGSTYFHMTIGSLVKGNKILCETSLGYKMDDLLTSYVNLYLNAVNKQRNSRFPV
ncbi:Unconventional myosin-VIIa [Acipenser ruthenus]|uniref:Unconventional myosin-VIIa n=1 Tax=Acipenser ruthenus TaxID=7906 RepID=A0A444UDH3_ACIRT|nr:Unconventional myosin-VIIa [Acipenser ruthenus]